MLTDPAGGADVPFSAVVLLEYHLPGPVTTAPRPVHTSSTPGVGSQPAMARHRLLDVRLGYSLGGACPAHTTSGGVVYGPAAPVVMEASGGGVLSSSSAVDVDRAAGSIASTDAVQLSSLVVRSNDVRTGSSFAVDAKRTGAPLLLRGEGGFIGQKDVGNAYGYYSVPRYAVTGTVSAPDCNGTVRPMKVADALGWLDHQWGTIALPGTLDQRKAQALYVRLGGKVPLVDRGFGIVGYEKWFAFQVTDAATGVPAELRGAALSANTVGVDPYGTLTGLALHGKVGFANGSLAELVGTYNVTGTVQCPLSQARAGKCDPTRPDLSRPSYATDYIVEFPALGVVGAAAFAVESVAPEQVNRYASGQPFWEGGAIGWCASCDRATDKPSVYAFVEQINVDPGATQDILAVAGARGDLASLAHAAETEYNFDNSS